MQKTSAVVAALAAAGTAWASPVLGDYSTYTQISAADVSMVSLDDSFGTQDRGTTTLFSNMDPGPTGYVAFGAAAGAIGFDDYTSTSASAFNLSSFRFVGGNVNAGQTMNVEFYNAAGDTLINAFSVNLSLGGNFIWTITLGSTFMVDGAGIVQLVSSDLSGGQWFLGDAGPSVGSEDNLFGGTGDGSYSHNFELNTPAPGSVALLGLGGLVATRRRR
ncbi:MAG: PEP-CTERM sorting domain-containing protein [Phycisphaerales bacterium]|nr:PEP-CTERM sorting domain-containing protein [Phycisphaerales bacterium]